MLKYTLDEVRTRELTHLETKGLPAAWWPLGGGNDCIAFQLWILGLRSGDDLAGHFISIDKFRKWAKWVEVPVVSIKAGDLVLEEWPDKDKPLTGVPGHMEWVYSVDHDAKQITTVSANTGPQPGIPLPRGVWKKTRPLDEHFLKGIRVPYKDPKVSNARAAEVRRIATYLNSLDLGRTSAAADDGVEGVNYYWLIQHWGHVERVYPKWCVEDGIPGDHTRIVERILSKLTAKLALAKAAKA